MSDTKKDKKELVSKTNDDSFRANFSSFLRNEHHTFVVQKTEKLASALYVVTGFIPSEDPLRTRLRTCAIELVSTSADPDRARESRYHEGFSSRCLEIGSILSLAQRAGFLSEMNAGILCGEYADLAVFVRDHHEKIFGNMALEVSGEKPTELFETHIEKPDGTQGQQTPNKTIRQQTPEAKRTQSKRHNSRRQAILRLLDKKDRISIKDAAKSIEGCSEKTIQRELIAMVQEGVLLKEGERRWSTYKKA